MHVKQIDMMQYKLTINLNQGFNLKSEHYINRFKEMGNYQCCQRVEIPNFQNLQSGNKHHHIMLNTEEREHIDKDIDNINLSSYIDQDEEFMFQKSASKITKPQIQIPYVSPKIRRHLINYSNQSLRIKYFQERLPPAPTLISIGKQIYEGQIDKQTNKPQGFGKIYNSDGSLLIGQFHKGKAQGFGIYLIPNGSYYSGSFHANYAEGHGQFWSENLEYQGAFKKNLFHGKGFQKSKQHEFSGEYYEGNKTQGVYKWFKQNNTYIYTGHFNFTNQFHGNGILDEPTGTYSGYFNNGQKHGKGIYKYKNGLRYEGMYKNGLKSGFGTIYNVGNTIAYEGQFENDIPHGKGNIIDPKEGKVQVKWIQGIDSILL